MRMMGCRALAVGLALAVVAPLAARSADAAVVICQKKNKLKLRVDTCTAKETQVDASELGVVGPPGAPGTDGTDGANGTAIAYAFVNADGTVDESKSFNITDANVTLSSTSAFCFHDLSFTPKSVVATIDYASTGAGGLGALARTATGSPFSDCSSVTNTQAEVATEQSGSFAPKAFFVIFN